MSPLANNNRRKFITDTTKGTVALVAGSTMLGSMLSSCAGTKGFGAAILKTGFDQKPLPYKYDALENVIDKN